MKQLSEMLQEAFVYGGNTKAVNQLLDIIKNKLDEDKLSDPSYFENILKEFGDSCFKGNYKIEPIDISKYKNSQITRHWTFRFIAGSYKILISGVSGNWGSSKSFNPFFIYANQEILCTIQNGKIESTDKGIKKMANVL